ncbi:UNKNOWN [Stylonychia lemnae]|uniref:Receptor expression-enhancing protein n=1 Tax=Stylonychia lemnae TaxID=5949 RepID=A0A078A5K4_STYLE|nr:UNKNOWN [Stylonychia lemnae]|eukprot:CDW77174.1 UNKNOWN [Stylonychia lemnae]
MDQLQQKLEIMNKEGEKVLLIKFISEKTKLPPSYIILGSLIASCLVLMLEIAESLISRLVGVVYPGIKSLYAIESADKADDKQWLTYWLIYAFFLVIDEYAGFILTYFPFYYFAKVCFLIWLFNPVTQGAQKIYEVLIELFRRNKDNIENLIQVSNHAINDLMSTQGEQPRQQQKKQEEEEKTFKKLD